MSGRFFPKYLAFLLFEAKKQGKNPSKSDIFCPGHTKKNSVCFRCKAFREGDVLRQGVFWLNTWVFWSSRPKNKVKTLKNRPSCVRVKRIKTVYAFAVKNAREGDILRQGVFWLNIWVFWSSKPKNKAKALKNRPFHVRVKRRKMLYTVPVKSWNDTAKIWQVGFWLNIWLFSFFVNDNR